MFYVTGKEGGNFEHPLNRKLKEFKSGHVCILCLLKKLPAMLAFLIIFIQQKYSRAMKVCELVNDVSDVT